MNQRHCQTKSNVPRIVLVTAMVGFFSCLPAQEQKGPLNMDLPPIPGALDSHSVKGLDGWLFLASEIRHLQSAAIPQNLTGEQDPVPAILDFQKSLSAKGIHLIVLPVPEKSLIRGDKLFSLKDLPASQGYAPATGRFIELLRKGGVDVMDTRSVLVAEAARSSEGRDPVYCMTDSHYTPRTCSLLAKAITTHLGTILPDVAKKIAGGPVLGPETSITIQGDLAPVGSAEKLVFQRVQISSDISEPPTSDPESPVLLLGDSHCLVFHSGGDMLAKGGGLPDYLGVELGRVPEIIAVRGSGATSARVNLYRKARKESSFLAKKKVVIWCFAAREFTQSDGWKVIPLP